MKRRVKYYKRKKDGKVYQQAWIGYSYRRKNGTPDFKREISLAGWDEKLIQAIDVTLQCQGDVSSLGQVEFLGGMDIGATWAVRCLMDNLGISEELDVLEEKRKLPILAMIADRIISPKAHSKLGLWETLPGSALERVLAPGSEMPKMLDDYYLALDDLYDHQDAIQKALFNRRDSKDCTVFLYDITSSYMEGTACPLSKFGYNRDEKKGKQQVVIGLLTDSDGRPLAVEVFEGNTSDQTTVMDRIDSMRSDFGIDDMVFVGDRGMLTKARRKDLEATDYSKVKYISALTRKEFLRFLEDENHPIQPELFDRHQLVEVTDQESGIRYILSFNPEKESEDRTVRLRLLEKTKDKLTVIQRNVKAGKWKSEKVIAKRLHTWLNKWNVGRFFNYEYSEGQFEYSINEDELQRYEALDGFYVLTTDTSPDLFDTKTVRAKYKSLAQVEQAFRTMKTTELFVRPIRHWKPERVKGHIFVCMLSYLVIWEARRKLTDFINNSPVIDEEANDPENACHSLRTIWETLDRGMQLGTIKVGDFTKEQINPINKKTKDILKAINASVSAKRIEELQLVG